jgi:hypothetical protein
MEYIDAQGRDEIVVHPDIKRAETTARVITPDPDTADEPDDGTQPRAGDVAVPGDTRS